MKKLMYSSMAVALLAAAAFAETVTVDDCVAFENGLGNYDKTCIKSGLLNMKEGTCYTMNPARETPVWINNIATETWWWVETECTTHEEEVVVVIPPDPDSYVLTSKCIEFENGQGHYGENCYNSGLLNMKEGTCYTMNPARETPVWINNIATETWWWVETDCFDTTFVSSSSVPEPESSSSDPESSSVEPASSSDCDSDVPGVCEDPSSSAEPESSSSDPESSSVEPESSSSEPESSSSVEYTDKCIHFVHGAGNYGKNCYISGLVGMKPGTCYKMNPARVAEYGDALYINNSAFDTFWWEETECELVEVIPPPDPSTYTLKDKGCIAYVHGVGGYADHCYNSGLRGMKEGACYVLNPDRYEAYRFADAVNGDAREAYWWQETLCADTVKFEPKQKSEPKVAGKISVENTTLSVVSTAADVKTLRVFDMNGKLLHSESFSGMAKDVDFAKFAGKGVLLVRVTSGNKLVAMKKVSIR